MQRHTTVNNAVDYRLRKLTFLAFTFFNRKLVLPASGLKSIPCFANPDDFGFGGDACLLDGDSK